MKISARGTSIISAVEENRFGQFLEEQFLDPLVNPLSFSTRVPHPVSPYFTPYDSIDASIESILCRSNHETPLTKETLPMADTGPPPSPLPSSSTTEPAAPFPSGLVHPPKGDTIDPVIAPTATSSTAKSTNPFDEVLASPNPTLTTPPAQKNRSKNPFHRSRTDSRPQKPPIIMPSKESKPSKSNSVSAVASSSEKSPPSIPNYNPFA